MPFHLPLDRSRIFSELTVTKRNYACGFGTSFHYTKPKKDAFEIYEDIQGNLVENRLKILAFFVQLTVFAELTVGEAEFARALLWVPAAVSREQLVVARRHGFLRDAFHSLDLNRNISRLHLFNAFRKTPENSPKCAPVCRRPRIGCRRSRS